VRHGDEQETLMTGAYRLAAWTSVARPHADVTGGALDMGTYAANLARVFRGIEGVPEVYRRPDRFFAATYLTAGLRSLLHDVLAVLEGDDGDRVLQLRTPFGGGKTHTLVALLHLARDRAAAAGIDGLAALPDPGPVQVAVLSGEELDPLTPRTTSDGTVTRTLWGELAAQLGRYDLVARHDAEGSAPGGETLRAVLGDGPVLVLLDEVLVYVEKAMAVVRGDSTLGRQAMLFVQALTEAINGHPRAAMVYSLQASVGEAVGAEGLLATLDHLVSRIDAKREPVTGDEVMRVVQRRLFADLGDPATQREVARAYADLHRRQLEAAAEGAEEVREAAAEASRLEQRIVDSYPLHPELLDLMYHRWGTLPSYQRTRGALQFLASVVHALWDRGSADALVGPGEVDLSDEATRGAFFSQVGERERYQAVLDSDVLTDGSGAAVVDRRIGADSPSLDRLRVGTRVATAVMLYSFGAREGDERGVLESDLTAGVLVPGLDRNVVLAALHDLREEELYLHHTGRRYRFEPTPNLTKLVRDEMGRYTADEVLGAVRGALETELAAQRDVLVWPDTVADGVPRFTFAYLHPDWSADTVPLERLLEHAGPSRRRFRNAVGFVLPDAAQFDRARQSARQRLAAEGLLRRRAQLGFSEEQTAELSGKAAEAGRDLAAAIGRAYSTVVMPVFARQGDRPYDLEATDLRSLLTAGRSLHARVREAVSHRVFDRMTVDKLVALAGLGPERSHVGLGTLVEWFFSYLEFTKVRDARVVADAVSLAVMEGRLGYVAAYTASDGGLSVRDPAMVRVATLLPADEIDLSDDAAVVLPALARALVEPNVPSPGRPDGDEGEPVERQGGASSAPQPDRPRPRPDQRPREVTLRVRVDGAGLFDLNRALSSLREQSTSVDVKLTVHAVAKGDGYEQVRFRNAVLEPLEESGAEVDAELR